MEAQSLKSLYHGPAQSGSWNSENLEHCKESVCDEVNQMFFILRSNYLMV